MTNGVKFYLKDVLYSQAYPAIGGVAIPRPNILEVLATMNDEGVMDYDGRKATLQGVFYADEFDACLVRFLPYEFLDLVKHNNGVPPQVIVRKYEVEGGESKFLRDLSN